ncbi:MAG: TGS domain-containing protein, partial [Acidobacteriota bacterium]
RFKYARVWGKTRFEGQMVERDYVLEDGDLLEVHD